jgi:hypothetical protein
MMSKIGQLWCLSHYLSRSALYGLKIIACKRLSPTVVFKIYNDSQTYELDTKRSAGVYDL